MEFIRNNVLLIGLALGSGIMLLLPAFKKGAGGVPNLGTGEAINLINRSHALVLDVRDDAEFATSLEYIVTNHHIDIVFNCTLSDILATSLALGIYSDNSISELYSTVPTS